MVSKHFYRKALNTDFSAGGLVRYLGPINLTLMGIGATIGAGMHGPVCRSGRSGDGPYLVLKTGCGQSSSACASIKWSSAQVVKPRRCDWRDCWFGVSLDGHPLWSNTHFLRDVPRWFSAKIIQQAASSLAYARMEHRYCRRFSRPDRRRFPHSVAWGIGFHWNPPSIRHRLPWRNVIGLYPRSAATRLSYPRAALYSDDRRYELPRIDDDASGRHLGPTADLEQHRRGDLSSVRTPCSITLGEREP
jgi:hypothetical protein